MMRCRIYGTVLLLLVLFAVPLQGQNESSQSWKIRGFIDSYHAVRVDKPNDFASSRSRLRAEAGKSFGASSAFVSFNAMYNAVVKENNGFKLREVYLDYRKDNWGLRAGRQFVIWGAADGVRITDLVSPMDMTEFLAQDYDDIRMPVNALRLFYFTENTKLEVVAVPAFEGYILPVNADNPWSVLPKSEALQIVWDDKGSTPALKLSNVEYGARLSFALPGIDFSLAALHTWNKQPVRLYEPSPAELKILPRYYRMGFVGGDFSKPLGQFVLRGEAAFNISKHFSYAPASSEPQKGFNTINWLLGVDWYAAGEWTLMAQFSSESIFGYRSYAAQPRHSSLLTFNVSKKLLNSTLELSDYTYFDVNYAGWFSRLSAAYALNDYITISLGYDWFRGDKNGMFAIYRHNSQAWFKAKYSF